MFLLACLAAGWLSLASLPGFGFAAGAVIAVGSVRREELLIVVVAPPALFLAAVASAGLVLAWQGGAPVSALSVAAAGLLTLSGAAPWLFGGLVGAVVLADIRGLRQCVSDLRATLADRPGRSGSAGQPSLSERWPRARAAIRAARRR